MWKWLKEKMHARQDAKLYKQFAEHDFSWMSPPPTFVDPAAWDQYWRVQLSHGLDGMLDLFCDDGDLVDVMRAHGLTRVLCVGNGMGQEPRALARCGFDVSALDLSPLATDIARRAAPPEHYLASLVGGRQTESSGRLEFVAGDLCDPVVCPGPYDVVIERSTLQLYSDADRPRAMQAVTGRLVSTGIFLSHCHDGAWRPPAPPRHALAPWFRAEGWPVDRSASPLTTRVAWLSTSTG